MTAPIAGGLAPSEVFDLDPASMAAARGLRDEWNELAAVSPGSSYFQTADWIWSWWETVARQAHTRVACWRAADRSLDAVAAVSRGRVMLHRRLGVSVPAVMLAGSGRGDADHCGALARPERRADVASWLRTAGEGRTLVAVGVAPDSGIVPLGARLLERTSCPRLVLDPADARVGRSPNFRTQLGRFSRRIARAGVTFEWLPAGTVEPVVVHDLLDLHCRLRRSRGQSTTLDTGYRALMLRCVERSGPERGAAAVVAHKGDDVVGVLLGFWWQGCYSAYQSGWDPAYGSFSPGSLLLAEAIRRCAAAGGDTFDFLRGVEPYKYRFGARDVDDRTVFVPAGLVGALLMGRARVMVSRDARVRRTAP